MSRVGNNVLEVCILFFYLRALAEAELVNTAGLGGRALDPGAFYACPAGMGMTRFGARSLVAPFPRGISRGDEPQEVHEVSGALGACQVFGTHYVSPTHRGD